MQDHKVQIVRRQFKLVDLAKELQVKKSVIRSWKKEFELTFTTNDDHYYTAEERKKLQAIKQLLHEQGHALSEAKELFKQKYPKQCIELDKASAETYAFTPAQEIVTEFSIKIEEETVDILTINVCAAAVADKIESSECTPFVAATLDNQQKKELLVLHKSQTSALRTSLKKLYVLLE